MVKIHVMNVENNSVNEIFQTGFCSVDTWHFALYFHNHSFCRILLVWGMHSFEQNSSALHPTPVLCIQVDPFIWALWSRLRVKTLEAGKPLSKPGNIPSRLYRWHKFHFSSVKWNFFHLSLILACSVSLQFVCAVLLLSSHSVSPQHSCHL